MAVARQKPKNVAEKAPDPLDSRVVRTRELIDGAFVAMLHRRAYTGIRVGDVTRKAGVARATFYAHYATKHDLLRSQLRRIVCPMIVATHAGACPIDATALFAHLAASPRIYRGLITGETGALVQQLLLACFESRMHELVPSLPRAREGDAIVPRGLADRFLAASLLTLVSWCVETRSTLAAVELQRIYAVLAGGLGNAGVGDDGGRGAVPWHTAISAAG